MTTATTHPTPVLTTSGGPTLLSTTRGEITKALSLRATWWCVVLGLVALAALPAVLMTQGDLAAQDLASGSGLSLMILMSMAAVLSTSDLQHGTYRVGRWANPHRWQGYGAKVLTTSLGGALIGLAGGVGVLCLGVLSGRVESVDAAVLQATLGQAPVFALACAIATALGLLVKRTGLAVAAILIWIQVIESLLPALPNVGDVLREWLPFMNAFMFTMPGNFGDAPHSPAVALAYFTVFAAVVVTGIGALTTRRDL